MCVRAPRYAVLIKGIIVKTHIYDGVYARSICEEYMRSEGIKWNETEVVLMDNKKWEELMSDKLEIIKKEITNVVLGERGNDKN